jgi:hypothetical protein
VASDELDESRLVGVLAHGLLNSMAVVQGTLATLLARGDQLDDETFAKLVTTAISQADHVSESLRGLVQGLPHDVMIFLDDLDREHRPAADD